MSERDIELAGQLDVADAYRRLADLAVEAASAHAAGLPSDVRERIDLALAEVDCRLRRLEAARRGYSRIVAERMHRQMYGPTWPAA